MNHNFTNLNIILSICLVLFIFPLILLPYKIIEVPEGVEMPIILVAVLFGLLYCVILGILVKKKNRSVIKWVGLTLIFLPIGHIVSYTLILTAKPIQKES